MWRCNACSYVWSGEEPPDTCPNCDAPKSKFGRLSDKAVEAIERAGFANSLLMQLHLLMDQVMDVAEDGLDDNLDPNCAKIFDQAFEQAQDLQQLVKAELQSHVGKGKWG